MWSLRRVVSSSSSARAAAGCVVSRRSPTNNVRRCCALLTAARRPPAALTNARRALSSTEQQPRREDGGEAPRVVREKQKKNKPKVPRDRTAYPIHQALEKVVGYAKEMERRKFDESVDLALSLNLDPRKPHQSIKTTVELPHGVGKSKRVAVFVDEELEPEFFAAATEAGADVVGGKDLVAKCVGGTVDFNAVVASPKMVAGVKKAARVLGPKGLLPGPKSPGSVANTPDELRECIAAIRKGSRITVKTEKLVGLLATPIGKVSMGVDKLADNLRAIMIAIQSGKPEKAPKGKFMLDAHLCSTMGKPSRISLTSIDPSKGQFMRSDLTRLVDASPVIPFVNLNVKPEGKEDEAK